MEKVLAAVAHMLGSRTYIIIDKLLLVRTFNSASKQFRIWWFVIIKDGCGLFVLYVIPHFQSVPLSWSKPTRHTHNGRTSLNISSLKGLKAGATFTMNNGIDFTAFWHGLSDILLGLGCMTRQCVAELDFSNDSDISTTTTSFSFTPLTFSDINSGEFPACSRRRFWRLLKNRTWYHLFALTVFLMILQRDQVLLESMLTQNCSRLTIFWSLKFQINSLFF